MKSVATLGNVEENDTVSRALARLSEVEEKVETLHSDQVHVCDERQLGSYILAIKFSMESWKGPGVWSC